MRGLDSVAGLRGWSAAVLECAARLDEAAVAGFRFGLGGRRRWSGVMPEAGRGFGCRSSIRLAGWGLVVRDRDRTGSIKTGDRAAGRLGSDTERPRVRSRPDPLTRSPWPGHGCARRAGPYSVAQPLTTDEGHMKQIRSRQRCQSRRGCSEESHLPGSHRSRRLSLPSPAACLTPGQNPRVQRQWAKRAGIPLGDFLPAGSGLREPRVAANRVFRESPSMRADMQSWLCTVSVCAVRRCGSSGGERPSPPALSQLGGGAGGSGAT
jgi:hypothetical protein